MDSATTTTTTTNTNTPTAALSSSRHQQRSRPIPRTPKSTFETPSARSSRRHSGFVDLQPAHSPSQYRAPQPQRSSNDLSNSLSVQERASLPASARPPSPDAQSRVSASSSAIPGGPQLRKKPKSMSIKHKRRSNSAELAVSVPSVLPDQNDQSAAALVVNSAHSSKPLTRADSTQSQPHSPVYKRPPASHSSYGVETICGPPPSFNTQRTLSQERIKKVDRNTILWSPNQEKQPSTFPDSSSGESAEIAERTQDNTASLHRSSPDTAETYSIVTPPDMNPMSNVTIRGSRPARGDVDEDNKGSSSDERKSEDLFLNIAKVDAGRPSVSTSKSDRRKSRISVPLLSSSRSVYETKSSPIHQQHNAESRIPQSEEPRYYSKRSSIGSHIPGALSRTNLNEADRFRERSVEGPSDVDRLERQFGRRNSNAAAEPSRLSQRPSQGLRGQRLVSDAGYANQSRVGEHIATESTVSTTAPSTVWDELDDLKSRIRKLELTGKLPPSSAAAMSSADRPRTATTAATTMSTSPKFKTPSTSLPSAVDGIPASIHPLLHEALGNAKQAVSQEVYHKLYATASDALQLATMMANESPSMTQSMSPGYDRQIRRRTENMCRGLTELAIALTAESKSTSSSLFRPGSRDQSHPPSAMLRSRRYSNDPGDKSATSRVTSRLDNRRASLVMSPMSPEPGMADSALPPLPGLRLARASTITRSRRGPHAFDGGADTDYDASPSIRPVSRAVTELSAYRRPSQDPVETLRDFTSQHPLPTLESTASSLTPRSSNAQPTIVSRRKYATGDGHESSPLSPREAVPLRDGWGRGPASAIEQRTPTDAASEMGRTSSSRRHLGLASRIGSSVGSRLRAVRADRHGRDSFGEAHHVRDGTPL